MYGKQMATAVDAAIRKAQTLEIKKAHIILCTCITSARSILRQTANIKQVLCGSHVLVLLSLEGHEHFLHVWSGFIIFCQGLLLVLPLRVQCGC